MLYIWCAMDTINKKPKQNVDDPKGQTSAGMILRWVVTCCDLVSIGFHTSWHTTCNFSW